MTVLGAGVLWFGWFGFNAGSALAAGPIAALALMTTQVATGAGALDLGVRRMEDPGQTDDPGRCFRRLGRSGRHYSRLPVSLPPSGRL